jgi:hypothetical protein
MGNALHDDRFVRLTIPAGSPKNVIGAWRNNRFLVQLYEDREFLRISVLRTEVNEAGTRWADGITWDELMDCKRGIGFGARWAIEIYPADIETVNVANIRHLFLCDEPPPQAWRQQ